MTRTSNLLPPASAVKVALEACARQGEYGAITELAREHGISRGEVYALRSQGRAALEAAFVDGEAAGEGRQPSLTLEITEADIARSIIAMRVVMPASIRDEVAMLPIIYGTGWSYGKVQGTLAEAERRAAAFNAAVDLRAVEAVALDEMFSQGKPVLGGIDLDTGYLLALELCPSRTAGEWTEVLSALQDDQGFEPKVVVKDAGSAMAKAVTARFPECQQRDDLFHALYLMVQVADHLERRAYAIIARVDSLEQCRKQAQTETERRSLGQQLRQEHEHMDLTIARCDAFETQRRQASRLLTLTERGSGRLRTPAEVEDGLKSVAGHMASLGGRARKIATYIRNRAAGLACYLGALASRLAEVAESAGGTEVVEAVVRAWQAGMEMERGGPIWDRTARRVELEDAVDKLLSKTERNRARVYTALAVVLPILVQRHRASSAIENLNSVLRPYLVVHKGVQQGFLNLFQFYWNTRIREWGPHKGTSAYGMLTGSQTDDWLTLLGYPPSQQTRAAA